jgi:transglutaminase-like putative cysteine protease
MQARPIEAEDRLQSYLSPTYFIDSDHPRVRAFAEAAVDGAQDGVAQAVRLYYSVRDGFRYDPYSIQVTPETSKASAVIACGRGYCVSKAVVLAATARAVNIPSRLGFADVRNHLATERLRQAMGTDVFYYHGFTELFLERRWVKATPAFNIELCKKFGVLPLAFDGRSDAIFHPFDAANRRHMEYVNDRGHRADLPFDELYAALLRYYPTMSSIEADADFYAEAEAERG